MAKQLDISIVILNFNTDSLLERCLESIKQHAVGVSFEVVVVNNGSTDPREIVGRFGFARLIQTKNEGFSAGNNAGAKEAKGRILLFLNSDTELKNDELKLAVTEFSRRPRLGLLIPRLVLPDGSDQPGIYGRLPSVTSAIKEKLHRGSDLGPGTPVEWVTGAALFIPRKLWEEVGGWDENFFMYMEDVDLGARVREAGYEADYLPGLCILHHVGSSTGSQADTYRRESQNYYYRKHFGPLYSWIFRIFRGPYLLLARLLGWAR